MPSSRIPSSVESPDFSNSCPVIWPRAIVLVDMNAFFASIEQRDRPEWRGRPVAVTNGRQGTCIITCSYEARAYGIKTGMRLREVRRLCPQLIQCPAHPERYAATSTAIMQALQDITPCIEVFSVDKRSVYIVTVDPELADAVHERWPWIMSG
jgi:DNA polymerase-4